MASQLNPVLEAFDKGNEIEIALIKLDLFGSSSDSILDFFKH